jgi:hypothetical protein
VAVSALLVFSSTDTAGYAVTRLWETGPGTVVTLALAPFLFPANPLTAARGKLTRVAAGSSTRCGRRRPSWRAPTTAIGGLCCSG